MKKYIFLPALFLSLNIAHAYDVCVDGIYYDLLHDRKEAIVTYKEFDAYAESNNSYSGNVNIPPYFTVNGEKYTVTSVKELAFANNAGLTGVSFPSTVKTIGPSAFDRCVNLKSVCLPDSISEISDFCFIGCTSLKYIQLPDGLKSIGRNSFADCTGLLSVGKIPASVESIGDGAFMGCEILYSVNIPPKLRKLPRNAFFNCECIKRVIVTDEWMPLAHNYFSGEPYFDKYDESFFTAEISANMPEIDLNIPAGSEVSPNTFALVIANENYSREANVAYALNDGQIFSRYAKETLRLPEENIIFIKDATLNDIVFGLEKIKEKCRGNSADKALIFYYAGHGVPDDYNRDAYLLPVDGYGIDVSTGFPLKELYACLETIPTSQTVVFLDACFSGTQRNGKMMQSTRGVRIKPKENPVKGNLIVLSATKEDETAHPYDDYQHGLFTYFLLKKLQDTSGKTTIGELADYISANVKRLSVLNNNRVQTPTVNLSPSMSEWQKLTLCR